MNNKIKYDESSIQSLDWQEHIRTRPGMYIGKLGAGLDLDDGIYDSLVMAIVRKTGIYYDIIIKKKSLVLMLFNKLSFLYISFFK